MATSPLLASTIVRTLNWTFIQRYELVKLALSIHLILEVGRFRLLMSRFFLGLSHATV
jgi:hypothetical protein